MQFIELPYSESPWRYLNCLADWPGLIWYHNGKETLQQEWLSARPSQNFEYLGQQITRVIYDNGREEQISGDFFELLKQSLPVLEDHEDGVFSGGLAGHLSYDLGLEVMAVSSPRSDQLQSPLAVVGLYHWSLQIDHRQQRTTLCIQDSCPTAIRQALITLTAKINDNPSYGTDRFSLRDAWHCQMSKPEYQTAFNRLKEYILAGDTYQVNLTRQWVNESADIRQADDLSVYHQLSQAMPAPFSVFHRTPEYSLLSVSPERFVQVRGAQIMTQPIKGTRPRGVTPAEDQRQRDLLYNSDKDRAENLMIVDLLRNDMARNADPGTVSVDRLFEIQSFPNVHHLVSTVSATKKSSSHVLDVLRDAFPGGSITGAPKKRAMEIVEELETTNRGNYCGCSFYVNARGDLDSNILIRTMTLTDGRLSCSGGGGIVHDSDVDAEYDESAVKVQRLLSSLT